MSETSNTDYPSPGVIENISDNFSTKTIILMVGLPLMGKSFIASKLKRFLSWLGFNTKIFSVRIRIKTPSPDAIKFINDPKYRKECCFNALDDLINFVASTKSSVGIFDSANCSKERRSSISAVLKEKMRGQDYQILWIESTSGDQRLVKIVSDELERKKTNPKFIEYLKDKMDYYRKTYEPLDNDEDSYIKIHEFHKITSNRVEGFITAKILYFLSNVQIEQRPIFFSRHGESEYNVLDKVGGDSPLSKDGRRYAQALYRFMKGQHAFHENTQIFCSTMKRTIETVKLSGFNQLKRPPIYWRILSEIEVGICDGMSYEEIKAKMPGEYEARSNDKLRYRYPLGESYKDLIMRVEPMLLELERSKESIFIVGHRAVLRCLYGYFSGASEEEIPHLPMPLHTVIKLEPFPFGCKETRYTFKSGDEGFFPL